MKNLPQKIYLNIGEECEIFGHLADFNCVTPEDVTHSLQRICDMDAEYVLLTDDLKQILSKVAGRFGATAKGTTLRQLADKAGALCEALEIDTKPHTPNRSQIPYNKVDLDNPQFEKAEKCHDWRNHVHGTLRTGWASLTYNERMIIKGIAMRNADNEQWD